MPSTPVIITLSANLRSFEGGTELAGYLRVTLCGFGGQAPKIPGTGMMADGGVPQLVGPQDAGAPPLSMQLYGNDAIVPAGTFYEIAVLDQNKDVIQANNYVITAADGTSQSLDGLTPVVPPYGFPASSLAYQPCTAAGSTFVSPGAVIAATYNGVLMPEGAALPILSYTLDATGTIITPNFTPDPTDRFDALCVL